jgi:glutamate dehydrogenase (NADP+)
VLDSAGIAGEKLEFLKDLWMIHRRPAKDYADRFICNGCRNVGRGRSLRYRDSPATENELNGADAEMLLSNGTRCVVEAANMPCTPEAVQLFSTVKYFTPPARPPTPAASHFRFGNEPNSMRLNWTREEVDARLHSIMKSIHEACVKYGNDGDFTNYIDGANIAGFTKVADSMIEQGVV